MKFPSAAVACTVGTPSVPATPAYESMDTSKTLVALQKLLVIVASVSVAVVVVAEVNVIFPDAAFTVPASAMSVSTMAAIVNAPFTRLTLVDWRLVTLASAGIVGGTADIILLIVNILILHLINLIKIYFSIFYVIISLNG
jgi:hypothetical protein